jgi:putative FmdB family regulatory protein
MPIYEYKCAGCGAILEVLQRMHDKPLKKCEACGGALEKMISRSSFQLKGSGWYVTDYARKGKGRSESDGSSSSSSSSSSEGSGSKKSDASSASGGGGSKNSGS